MQHPLWTPHHPTDPGAYFAIIHNQPPLLVFVSTPSGIPQLTIHYPDGIISEGTFPSSALYYKDSLNV